MSPSCSWMGEREVWLRVSVRATVVGRVRIDNVAMMRVVVSKVGGKYMVVVQESLQKLCCF